MFARIATVAAAALAIAVTTAAVAADTPGVKRFGTPDVGELAFDKADRAAAAAQPPEERGPAAEPDSEDRYVWPACCDACEVECVGRAEKDQKGNTMVDPEQAPIFQHSRMMRLAHDPGDQRSQAGRARRHGIATQERFQIVGEGCGRRITQTGRLLQALERDHFKVGIDTRVRGRVARSDRARGPGAWFRLAWRPETAGGRSACDTGSRPSYRRRRSPQRISPHRRDAAGLLRRHVARSTQKRPGGVSVGSTSIRLARPKSLT